MGDDGQHQAQQTELRRTASGGWSPRKPEEVNTCQLAAVVGMALLRRPSSLRAVRPPLRPCGCSSRSTPLAARSRALSTEAEDTSVGVVHPQRSSSERHEYLQQARTRLPVFPLGGTVVFPGQRCPLYIFEPRYRVLIQRLLKPEAHRYFAIFPSLPDLPPWTPGATPERPDVQLVGTIVEITHNHWNEDGSASVVTRGVCRVTASTSALTTGAFGYHELPEVLSFSFKLQFH